MQRFLVMDDHRLFLEGMRHLLSVLGDDVSVELTSSVESALAKIDQGSRYELLLIDISLPENLYSQLEIVTLAKRQEPVLMPAGTPEIGERQLDVLKLMDEGLSNKQIAKVLAISEATVKYHIGVLFKHLDAKNRTSCLHIARGRKLIKAN